MWHPPEGKYHVLGGIADRAGVNDLPHSQTPYLNVVFG